MRRLILILLCVVALRVDASPQAKYAPMTLTALTATVVPFTLTASCTMLIRNNDTAAIYYGFDASVTDSTGFNIAASGGAVGIPFTYQSSSVGTRIFLYSVAGTSTGAVRYAATCL